MKEQIEIKEAIFNQEDVNVYNLFHYIDEKNEGYINIEKYIVWIINISLFKFLDASIEKEDLE